MGFDRKWLQQRLINSLAVYDGEFTEEIPSGVNSQNCHTTLPAPILVNAAFMIEAYLGLFADRGNIDVYTLLNAYYRNPKKRALINRIIGVPH